MPLKIKLALHSNSYSFIIYKKKTSALFAEYQPDDPQTTEAHKVLIRQIIPFYKHNLSSQPLEQSSFKFVFWTSAQSDFLQFSVVPSARFMSNFVFQVRSIEEA